MILVNMQLDCDGEDCRSKVQVSGNPDSINNEFNKVLERGWERRGRKCFCPACSQQAIGSGASTSDLRLG